MQVLHSRQRLVAQNFLSSICLDVSNRNIPSGSGVNRRTNQEDLFSSKKPVHIGIQNENDQIEKSVESSDKLRLFSSKSGQQISNVETDIENAPQKSVSFGESLRVGREPSPEGRDQSSIAGALTLKPSIRQQFNIGSSPPRSLSCTTDPPTRDAEHAHPDYYSCRYVMSTKNVQSSPLVVASIIPLLREPMSHCGQKFGVSGVTTYKRGAGGPLQEQMTIFNNLFRHASRRGCTDVVHIAGTKLGDSDVFTVAQARPLCFFKALEPEQERSYAHFLRNGANGGGGGGGEGSSRGQHRTRHRTDTDGNTSSECYYYPGQANSSSCTPPAVQPLSVSTSSLNLTQVAAHVKKLSPAPEEIEAEISPTTNGFQILNGDQCPSTSSVSSHIVKGNTTMQDRFVIVYEDPLIHYNPALLDDPLLPQLTNRRVFTFAGYMTSILGYRRPNEQKRCINREFSLRFPSIQLTLSKMRSLKLALLSIALRMNLDLWTVAHTYVLFEKMILKLLVCKFNRKLCAGAAMLISAKLNDAKGAVIFNLIQELETEFRVSRRDLVHMELASFIGLEFTVGASDDETQPHFRSLHKYLGLVSGFQTLRPPSQKTAASLLPQSPANRSADNL